MPLLPLAFGLASLLHWLHTRTPGSAVRPLGLVLGGGIVVALAARTVSYEQAWSSEQALWRHATRTHPDAFYAWIKLGEWRRDHGRLDAAVDAYERAIETAPQLRLGHGSLFYTLALRDERERVEGPVDLDLSWCVPEEFEPPTPLSGPQRSESAAWEAARCYYTSVDAPRRLRHLAGTLVGHGYRDAVRRALNTALPLQPLSDRTLENAARTQLDNDRRWLVRLYLRHMGRPPVTPQLRPLWKELRQQARDGDGS